MKILLGGLNQEVNSFSPGKTKVRNTPIPTIPTAAEPIQQLSTPDPNWIDATPYWE